MEKMNFLIDTDILIDISKGIQNAAEYIESLKGDLFISVITSMELIVGARNKEEIKEKAACIRDFGNFSQEEVYNAFKKSFLKNKDFFTNDLNNDEWNKINELLKNKYKNIKWNFNFNKPVKGSCHVQQKNTAKMEVKPIIYWLYELKV